MNNEIKDVCIGRHNITEMLKGLELKYQFLIPEAKADFLKLCFDLNEFFHFYIPLTHSDDWCDPKKTKEMTKLVLEKIEKVPIKLILQDSLRLERFLRNVDDPLCHDKDFNYILWGLNVDIEKIETLRGIFEERSIKEKRKVNCYDLQRLEIGRG